MEVRYSHNLSFDNIRLIPQYSDIASRLDVDLTTQFTRNIKIDHPIIPTNMSTVTGEKMIRLLSDSGGVGFLHRFMPYSELVQIIERSKAYGVNPLAISVGVKDEDRQLIKQFQSNPDLTPNVILIDIAHGESKHVVDMLKFIKDSGISADIVAGNIATVSGYTLLAEHGADAVRVGISGGSVCSTKFVTGHSVPTIESVHECAAAKKRFRIPIIADGGVKHSGDIVKLLAFGADSVCSGGLFAGSSETPGDIYQDDATGTNQYKLFYGMSSAEAQIQRDGKMKKGIAPEGVCTKVPYSGATSDILEKILGGVRSGLTYSGARTISEFQDKVIVNITEN